MVLFLVYTLRVLAIDPQKEFDALTGKFLNKIEEIFPIKDRLGKFEVRVANLRVQDDLGVDDIKGQYAAKVGGRNWFVPVYGDVEVLDTETKKVLSTRQGARIAGIPKLTRHYSYIIGGQEKYLANQWRLKPGVYVKEMEKPGEFKAQFQLSKGPAFNVHVDQEKQILYMDIRGRKIPLYAVLSASGVSDAEMEKAWGADVLDASKKKLNVDAAMKAFHKVVTGTEQDATNKIGHKELTTKFYDSTEMSSGVTEQTLGKPFHKVTPEALLLSSSKLLKVAAGTQKPDPIDSLQFKDIWGPADHFIEALEREKKDIQGRVQKVLSNPKRATVVRDVMAPDLFTRPIMRLFSTAIAGNSTQTNPTSMLADHALVTIMGPGGIENPEQITGSNQAIDPTHLGVVDPVNTPESNPGVTLRLTAGVQIKNRRPHVPLYNLKTHKLESVPVDVMAHSNVVLPDQVSWDKGGKPKPLGKTVRTSDTQGEIQDMDFSKAHYVMPASSQVFSLGTNLVPFMQNDSAGRSVMSARHLAQAISLEGREQPLVQVGIGNSGATFEQYIGGTFLSHRSPVAGHVKSIHDDHIVISDAEGKDHSVHVYDHYPLNDVKSMLHSTSRVKVGDKVGAGQLLADNNYTKEGVLSLGTNLRTAYLANGMNHEDGIVISESAAHKLRSQHLYKPSFYATDNHKIDKRLFLAQKGLMFTAEQLKGVGDDGVIKVGSVIKPGDPMVLALNTITNPGSVEAKALRRLGRMAKTLHTATPVVWDHDFEGEVVAVHQVGPETTIHVKTREPMQVGSKISTRHSAKGIVTAITPDDQMPFYKDAKGNKVHVEMLLNSVGVAGRNNPGQILETVAGKIAEKTGKPYVVKNFDGGTDYLQKVKAELKSHGLSETETLWDPKTGRRLGDITVGPHYALQLHHQIDKKTSVRAGGGGDIGGAPRIFYDRHGVPRSGMPHGGQSLGTLGVYAALAHGLRNNLAEMQTLKSDYPQAEQVWTALHGDGLLPPPQIPFVYKKFEAMLTGLGLNVKKDGSQIRLIPRSNAEILSISSGEIKKPDRAIIAKNMQPEKQGIFDPQVTGGLQGQHWSHIALVEPMPNPVFAKSISSLLGVKEADISEIVSGRKPLKYAGEDFGHGGLAFQKALKSIDVQKELKIAKTELDNPKLKGSELNKAYFRYKTLENLHDKGQHDVSDAYILRNVPVLPPIYRPVGELQGNNLKIDPLNQLYRRLGMANLQIKGVEKEGLSREDNLAARGFLYKEIENLFGTTAKGQRALDIDYSGKEVRTPDGKKRMLSGILHTLVGEKQPKDSYFQENLVEKRQDFSARATIIANPALSVDQVGVPKKIAFELFRPMVAKRLTLAGFNPIQAHEQITKRTEMATRALEHVVEHHPVLMKRDPVLHAYGLVGQKVVLTNAPAITVSPLILPPLGGDLDGDTVSLLVPLGRKAIDEAYSILPTAKPLSHASGGVLYQPANEAPLAIYRTSIPTRQTKHEFKNTKEADAAFYANTINLDDAVTIGGIRTTLGRSRLAAIVPDSYKKTVLENLGTPISKKYIGDMLADVAKHHPNRFEGLVNGISGLGFQLAYESGHSVTLKDLEPLRAERNKILAAATKKVQGAKTDEDRQRIWKDATKELHEVYGQHFSKNRTNVWDMRASGIKANKEQFQGLVMAPMLVSDYRGTPSKIPVTRSFAEGVDLGGYWLQSAGARRGLIQKTQSTAEPGYLTKQLTWNTIDQHIVAQDCGTSSGLMLPVAHKDLVDRHLATDTTVGSRVIKAGTVVTPEIQREMANNRVSKVSVRSPLKCRMPDGICAVCMGLHPSGQHFADGTNVGIITAQSLGERATQLMLKQTHGGGIVPVENKGVLDEFATVQSLLAATKRGPEHASLAPVSSKITAINKAVGGGYHIQFEGQKKTVHSRNKPLDNIRVGTQVTRGDQLTHGDPNIHDILEHRGLGAVQDYMTQRIGDIYQNEGVRQRWVELLVRQTTGLSRITDPGGHPTYVRGDYVMKPVIDEINRNGAKTNKDPIKATSVLKGIKNIHDFHNKDWMGKLQSENLKKYYLEGAHLGQPTDVHGNHPIPALAYAKEFGRPPPGSKGRY